jgi:hypothetical protein
VTESEYSLIDAIRWSHLREMKLSPKHFKAAVEKAAEDAAHFRIGRAIHCYVLEPDAFDQTFVCYRESKSVGEGARKKWQAFQEAHADRTILSVEEHDAAVGAACALLSHSVASRLLSGGVKEHLVQWVDDETGLRCKGRLDQANGHLCDIKSGRSVEHRQFAAQAARLSYHGQLAFYLDGAIASGMEIDPEPIILAVESAPPHDVVCYRMTESIVELGRREYHDLLGRLAECRARDRWPGQAPDTIVELVLPEWAYADGTDPLELVVDGERVAI